MTPVVERLRIAAALARFNLHAHSPDGCDDVDPSDDMLTALNDIATRIRTRTAA